MSDSADPGSADAAAPTTRAEARRAADSAFQAHVRAAKLEFEQHIGKARADFEQANERINERTGRNLIVAIAMGLAIGAVVIGSLLFVKWAFLLFAIPVALLGVFEFARALQASGRRVDLVPQLVVGAAMMIAGYFLDHTVHWIVVFAGVAIVLVWRLIVQMVAADVRPPADVLTDVLVAGLVMLYVPFLASLLLILLRQDQGELWVLAMIATAVAADTGAYATGLAFGRHPMAPRISPKKTWEGFAGAVVVALAVAIVLSVFVLHVPLWVGAVFGALVLLAATAGDLGESMIKRDLGIKDMSSWLPGHGGVLDRLDSILLSVVAALATYFLFVPRVMS